MGSLPGNLTISQRRVRPRPVVGCTATNDRVEVRAGADAVPTAMIHATAVATSLRLTGPVLQSDHDERRRTGEGLVLEGLLTPQAEELYGRLLVAGVVRVNDSSDLTPNSVVVRELVNKHFAMWATDRLVPVAPRLAIESALLILERGIVRTHEACLNALTSMEALQEAYERAPGREAGDHRVRIIGEAEAAKLLAGLIETARHEVLSFQIIPAPGHPLWTSPAAGPGPPAWLDPDGALTERLCRRGVRVRCIVAKDFLDSPHARDTVERYVRQGLEVRAIHALPTTMIVVDSSTALVPLDSGGSTGAVIFRHSAATDLLQATFELHWNRSVPLIADDGSDSDAPSGSQLLILRLLAAGMRDESIARHLRVSLRTVRRNITTLCDKVGAPTRFTLATIAVERGWIGGCKTPAGDGAPRDAVRRGSDDGRTGR